jgi:Flp pilus assembly protein TadG
MLVLFAAVLPVIILFCGLTLDVGTLELKKLQMQTAADAAVIGAQQEAERGTNNWPAIGIADAGINGFTNGSHNTTVTLTQQPTSGGYAGRYDALQATVTQTVSTIFLGALNGGTITLSAQASALLTPCLFALGTGTLGSFSIPYGIDVQNWAVDTQSCPVYTNSNMRLQSGANMTVEGVTIVGSAASSSIAGFMYPSPTYNVPSLPDPLANLAQPTVGSCTNSSSSLSSGTYSAGYWCNGMNITNATVTLNPGLYIIGNRTIWSGATVTGNGVTLFFPHVANPDGPFVIYGASNVTLSAATDSSHGAIPGVVVFADRNWIPGYAEDFAIFQNSTIQGDGIWYLPAAGFSQSGSNSFSATNYTGIVANNIILGNSVFHPLNNYSNLPGGNPFRPAGGLVQ